MFLTGTFCSNLDRKTFENIFPDLIERKCRFGALSYEGSERNDAIVFVESATPDFGYTYPAKFMLHVYTP